MNVVEIRRLAAERREGDPLKRALAKIGVQVDGYHSPIGRRRRRNKLAGPALNIPSRSVTDVPVLFVVELQHDSVTAVRLPGVTQVSVLARLRLLRNAVFPVFDARRESLHGNDFDAGSSGEDLGFLRASLTNVASRIR